MAGTRVYESSCLKKERDSLGRHHGQKLATSLAAHPDQIGTSCRPSSLPGKSRQPRHPQAPPPGAPTGYGTKSQVQRPSQGQAPKPKPKPNGEFSLQSGPATVSLTNSQLPRASATIQLPLAPTKSKPKSKSVSQAPSQSTDSARLARHHQAQRAKQSQ
jgi:hypothetical protein